MQRPRASLFVPLLFAACNGCEPAPRDAPTSNTDPRAISQPRDRTTELGETGTSELPNRPKVEDDPWARRLAERTASASGLGAGSPIEPFAARRDDGKLACPVCDLERPTIMAVGTLNDPAFVEDLKDFDALVYKFDDQHLAAIAIVTPIVAGAATVPDDADAFAGELARLRRALNLPRVRVFAPAGPEANAELELEGEAPVWSEYWNITRSRTVMLLGPEGKVLWAGVGGDDWADLGRALETALARKPDHPSDEAASKGPGGRTARP